MNWESSILWGIIGLVGGFLISLLFYIIGSKRKKLSFEVKTFSIISEKVSQVEGLEVTYHSQEIDNLYSSTIVIKNIGNSVVEQSDFAPACPLSMSTNGMFLTDKSNGMKLFPLNKANNVYPTFDISEENNMCSHIVINFDYISKKEELTCSIFHTGEIKINGVLKDGKILNSAQLNRRKKIFRMITDLILSLIGALITYGGLNFF